MVEGDAVTEALLFDFNGVLVDDEAQHCEALQAVLCDEAITLSREQYYADYLGLDDRTGFVQAFRRANRTLTTEILNRLVEAKSRVYLALVAKSLRLVPGGSQILGGARRALPVGNCFRGTAPRDYGWFCEVAAGGGCGSITAPACVRDG